MEKIYYNNLYEKIIEYTDCFYLDSCVRRKRKGSCMKDCMMKTDKPRKRAEQFEFDYFFTPKTTLGENEMAKYKHGGAFYLSDMPDIAAHVYYNAKSVGRIHKIKGGYGFFGNGGLAPKCTCTTIPGIQSSVKTYCQKNS